MARPDAARPSPGKSSRRVRAIAYPVVILASGERLVTPTLRELAEKLGLQTAPANTAYDLAIIGGGPGGSCGGRLWRVGRTALRS